MRTLEIMNSNASSDIQGIVTDLLNSRPYSHRQDADSSVAAVITAQSDLRFFSSTFAAVLAQRVLPGTIIVADCTNQVEQPMQMTFSVIPSPAGVLTEVPESKTIRVILVGVKGASSFMNAVARAMQQIDLDDRVGALWTFHDDSRPADESCLEVLLDAWKNTPTASLLGAKQLDWQAESLHNVGLYAGHHNVTSLVVDGEPDQEQYDGRQDVLAVSLSGALVPLATLRTWKGADPWFGTFAESTDLCRRICLGGGRVVVVPQARIAHRRARFEGVRSKNGQPVEDEEGRVDPYLAVREANTKYAYTDVHRSWWPLLWIWSILKALGLAVLCLTRKQPYHACCELALPWRSLLHLPGAWRARARLREQSRVSLKALAALQTTRQQIGQWNDRKRAFLDQRGTVILSPLAKAHLRKRLMRRWACHRIGGDRLRMDRLPILECASERILRRVDIFSNVAADRCQFQPVGACRHHVVGVYRGNWNQRPERALAAGAHGGFRIHGWPCCDRSRRGVLLVRSFDGAVVLGFGWNLYSVRHGALRDRVGMVRHRIVDERVQRCRRDDDDGHGVSSCGLRVFFPSRRHVPYGRSGQSAGFRAGRGACGIVLYSRRRGRTAIAAAADVVVPCVPDACTLP